MAGHHYVRINTEFSSPEPSTLRATQAFQEVNMTTIVLRSVPFFLLHHFRYSSLLLHSPPANIPTIILLGTPRKSARGSCLTTEASITSRYILSLLAVLFPVYLHWRLSLYEVQHAIMSLKRMASLYEQHGY